MRSLSELQGYLDTMDKEAVETAPTSRKPKVSKLRSDLTLWVESLEKYFQANPSKPLLYSSVWEERNLQMRILRKCLQETSILDDDDLRLTCGFLVKQTSMTVWQRDYNEFARRLKRIDDETTPAQMNRNNATVTAVLRVKNKALTDEIADHRIREAKMAYADQLRTDPVLAMVDSKFEEEPEAQQVLQGIAAQLQTQILNMNEMYMGKLAEMDQRHESVQQTVVSLIEENKKLTEDNNRKATFLETMRKRFPEPYERVREGMVDKDKEKAAEVKASPPRKGSAPVSRSSDHRRAASFSVSVAALISPRNNNFHSSPVRDTGSPRMDIYSVGAPGTEGEGDTFVEIPLGEAPPKNESLSDIHKR